MNKEERIARYGIEAYKKLEAQRDAWKKAHPDEVVAFNAEQCRKGGKYYNKRLIDKRTGIPGEKKNIRTKHQKMWRHFKNIIAPSSQIHHEWIPGTAKYRGVALVEKGRHMHGFIDVIRILEGNIKLFTEDEIRSHGVEI